MGSCIWFVRLVHVIRKIHQIVPPCALYVWSSVFAEWTFVRPVMPPKSGPEPVVYLTSRKVHPQEHQVIADGRGRVEASDALQSEPGNLFKSALDGAYRDRDGVDI